MIGLSAYDKARINGFSGSYEDFVGAGAGLSTTKALNAFEVAQANGFSGTVEDWLGALQGQDGASAYIIAVRNGFNGTEAEWLESLKGSPGRSAYLIWRDVNNGGTVQEFLASLVGDKGANGDKGDKGDKGERGADGLDGSDGDAPEHEWQGSQLRFRNPDGSWGDLVNLEGRPGIGGVIVQNTGGAGAEEIQNLANDPPFPANGDVWYNTTLAKFRARENGVTIDLAGGGGGTNFQTYTHNQNSASAVWSIPHNLGRNPSVTVTSIGGIGIMTPEFRHDSTNVMTLTFDVPFSGIAYLV